MFQNTTSGFCTLPAQAAEDALSDVYVTGSDVRSDLEELYADVEDAANTDKPKAGANTKKSVDFTKVDLNLLPTVLVIGRPNVGKSALFNRLIRRREALVYNTPTDHVTRDIREGIAKLSDLRFKVLDSAGLEAEASSGSVLRRTAEMTGNVLAKSQFALFLIDARDGLQPMDLDVGKWLRKHASGIKTIVLMNKSESLDDGAGSLAAAAGEAHLLGFGDPIAISAETGLGMTELYETLRPLLEEHMLQVLKDEGNQEDSSCKDEESKLPLQLAIVGRPNVGKSTLLNTLLQEDRVLVGPEAGLTRDSVRAQFEYQGRTIYLVDTAGWLERSQRTKHDKGPASLSIVQSRKNLMRAHVVALVLDAEEIAKTRRSMKHAEIVIARQAVEEGRGLVVIVNKMDLLKGKLREIVVKAVPEEVQTLLPQRFNPLEVMNIFLIRLFFFHSSGVSLPSDSRAMMRSNTEHDEQLNHHEERVTKLQSEISEMKRNLDMVLQMMLRPADDQSSSTSNHLGLVMEDLTYSHLRDDLGKRVTGIPVVFVSALEGRGRTAMMRQVISTYEQWCSRLSTARLNRWLRKVMSRHSWKDQAAQPKIKYFTQVKARPPTFVAFLRGKTELSDTDLRFLTKSLKEDFDLGGIPLRIMQRAVVKSSGGSSSSSKSSQTSRRVVERMVSDKRGVLD
ncbi:GTP-binding protein [Actinidia rufa]|uniref:GTPase Der n=1 Tax=Actinidia rufa TaxID=165716 RepID=A0A7J0F6R2_9ERIC|nr:GTP-binding protein [Actinidia rufa]